MWVFRRPGSSASKQLTGCDPGVGRGRSHPKAGPGKDLPPSPLKRLLVGVRSLWAAGQGSRSVPPHVSLSIWQLTIRQLTSLSKHGENKQTRSHDLLHTGSQKWYTIMSSIYQKQVTRFDAHLRRGIARGSEYQEVGVTEVISEVACRPP